MAAMAGTAARVAVTCSDEVCTRVLARGDQIEFVSVEQAKAVGCKTGACPMALDEERMPSDIVLTPGFVLVHDTEGAVFGKCEFYVVRWKSRQPNDVDFSSNADMRAAKDYFGTEEIEVGSVEIPRGPWVRVCRVQLIRYRRYGYAKGFEHPYATPVWLHECRKPLAWKLALPEGCIVNERGFIKP